jgi:hypothetical protein
MNREQIKNLLNSYKQYEEQLNAELQSVENIFKALEHSYRILLEKQLINRNPNLIINMKNDFIAQQDYFNYLNKYSNKLLLDKVQCEAEISNLTFRLNRTTTELIENANNIAIVDYDQGLYNEIFKRFDNVVFIMSFNDYRRCVFAQIIVYDNNDSITHLQLYKNKHHLLFVIPQNF